MGKKNYTNIYFHPAVKPAEICSYLSGADVGLVPTWNKHNLSYWYALDNKLFEYTIFNRWGLLFPYAKRTDIKNYYKTIQGINYRYAKPNDYATAWTVDNVYLSDKFYKYKASRYIHEHQYKTTLVFVAGPNNNNPGTNGEINSVFRTYNKETDKNFHLFMNGVEAALFAGLIAMVYSKCNVALLVNVSGGLYRGTHDKDDYKHAYLNSLDNLLMNVQINGVELGSYFDAVYLL